MGIRILSTAILLFLIIACSSQSSEVVTHNTIPQAIEGQEGHIVTFRQVFISIAPQPALVLEGSKWGFQAYHKGVLLGEGTMLVYIDADAINFELKPGEAVRVEGVLVQSQDQLTVGATIVERLSCNDTATC